MFSHHEASTRSASTSSFRAKNAKNLSAKTIRESKVAIDTFEYEVEAFNDEMKEIIERENARIEHEEKIKANAGQPLDYFLPQAQLTSSPKRISRQASAASVGKQIVSPRNPKKVEKGFGSSIQIKKL